MSRILVVDDDSSIINFLRLFLNDAGYDVTDAADGIAGFAQAISQTPDLIILDMNMPGKTGWEVLHDLKLNPATENIPVIALTAETTSDDRDQAYDAGCDAFVDKPVDPDHLMSRIKSFLPD